jgi:alpha-glucosidase
MNEPASFCEYPCLDPWAAAAKHGFPPKRTTPPPDPNAPIFGLSPSDIYKREISLQVDSEIVAGTQGYKHIHDDPLDLDTWSTVPVTPSNLTEEQMNNPPYNISNAAGVLGDLTAHVTAVHHNGLREYDTRSSLSPH